MNSSPANKNLFINLYILYLKNKISCAIRIYFVTIIFIPVIVIFKPLNDPLASCSIINPDFFLLQNAHFYQSIGFTFFVYATSEFLPSVFVLHFGR